MNLFEVEMNLPYLSNDAGSIKCKREVSPLRTGNFKPAPFKPFVPGRRVNSDILWIPQNHPAS
jgi:hypothetical protein